MSNTDAAMNLTMYCTICAGIVSHFFLLICLAKDPLKCFRNSASYLVGNLALADFSFCTFSLFEMTFADKLPTELRNIPKIASSASLFSIFSIAIDLYILTVHPFKHRILLNGTKVAIWILSIWVLSLLYFIKDFVFGLHRLDFIILLSILIAVALLTALIYLVTFFSLRKQGRNITRHGRQGRNQILQQEFLKTIIIVAFIQIFTLLPTTIAGLISMLLFLEADTSIIVKILYQLYVLNFAINPYLYMWRLKNYRRTFSLVFCKSTR